MRRKTDNDDWKSEVYTLVTKSNTPVEAPDNFDEWLDERMTFRKDSGKLLISERNREIFYRLYRDNKTLQEVANEFGGVTRENIRQTKVRTLKNLMTANKHLTPKEWIYKNGNVFEMPMSQRLENCIYSNQITTIKQLDQMLADGSFKKLRGIGKKTMTELRTLMTDWKIMQEGSQIGNQG